ncbi:MAG: response regulator, partial [Candidatus Sericytochromatia bacterium]
MLSDFATYLHDHHFEEMVAEELRLAHEMQPPLLRLFPDPPGLRRVVADTLRAKLAALAEGREYEQALASFRAWEADALPGVPREAVVATDLVLAYSAEKQTLLRFLPRFTEDLESALALTTELERHYTQVTDAAFQTFARVQLEGANQRLELANRELQVKNEALERLNVEAEAANRLKSEFLANMSHELRTPMNSIIGFTELVLTKKSAQVDPRSRGDLEVVLRNAQNLLALINDILDISKIEAGKTTLFPSAVDLAEVVGGVIGTTEQIAAEKGLTLTLAASEPLGAFVTDEAKLRQILLNLVSNAIKFTAQGGIAISIRPSGDEQVAIVVADSGIGIAPDDQRVVFEEFRQVDASSTREAGGTGLGLAIARKLAQLLGGDITLESTLGVGSRFTVTLPRLLPSSALQAVAPVPPARIADQRMDGKHVILSIDDEPDVLRLISEKLTDSSYVVVPATTGESGIALAKQLKPFAITLDVLMPKMDGWTVLQALKQDPETRDIPVVILSIIENQVLGFSLGASAYLPKPIDRTELLKNFERFKPQIAEGEGYVLVVDDDPDARALYRRLLTEEGIRVREAVDGHEAKAAIEQELPTFVLLDLMMPRMDGFEVVAWLRSRSETLELPVVVVTAKSLS